MAQGACRPDRAAPDAETSQMGHLLARNTALERPCAACTRDACVRSSSALAPRHAKRLPPESRFFVGLETLLKSLERASFPTQRAAQVATAHARAVDPEGARAHGGSEASE